MSKFINGVTNYSEWRDHTKDNKRYLQRMANIALGIRDLADELRLVQSVVVSEMTGKLENFYSLSTSVLMNPICQARAKIPGCICQKCYAAGTASRNSGLCQSLETNYHIMNDFLISEAAWATLSWPTKNGYSRVESFGDSATVNHPRNFIRIIKTHPQKFSVWSKNTDHWLTAFQKEGGKPKNMKFIVSSPMINQVVEIDPEILPYVDHVFTVVTQEWADEHGIEINCGGRHCESCLNCYEDGPFYIYELLK